MNAEMIQRRNSRVRLLAGAAISAVVAFSSLLLTAQPADRVTAGHERERAATWQARGASQWHTEKGELVGRVMQGGAGGWLVSDRSYQDVGISFAFQCSGDCQTGVLLGMEQEGDRTSGIYVSLGDPDLGAYDLTIDSQGEELTRRIPEMPARAESGRGRGATAPPVLPAITGHPLAAPKPPAGLRRSGWNEVEIRYYTQVNATSMTLQVVLNGTIVATGFPAGVIGPGLGRSDRIAMRPQIGRFGPFALRLKGGPGAALGIKDISILPYTEIAPTVEKVSSRFRLQRVQPYFYADGSAVCDVNLDGSADIVTGPMYWLGPDFRVAREIDIAYPLSLTDYAIDLGSECADFTGDGWPDVLATGWPNSSPVYLYVNPRNELRRWKRYKVVDATGEIFALADIDGDGRPEYVYSGDGYAVNYAKPDPSDPTRLWTVHHLTEKGNWGNHGLGVGDINGDGRPDVLRAWGWWEQPADPAQVPWKFHPEVFGGNGPASGPGGAQMAVYDVNGDGRNDVITSMEAHGYGLAWYEQKRANDGTISFEEHIIMNRDGAQSHGVVFTELHGLTLADVDGDGLLDIITGKNKYNYGGHYEYTYPREDDEGVLYWFQLRRLPGGRVDFVPHLIHNDSGVGRQPRAVDLNRDGVMDIVNSGRFGTMVFWGRKGALD